MNFKYIVISFLIVFITKSSGIAQVYIGGKLGTGPSFYGFPGKTGESAEFEKNAPKILNFIGGLVVEYPLFAGFSAQAEIQYMTKGARRKDNRSEDPAYFQGYYFSDISPSTEDANRNGIAEEGETFYLPNLYRDIELNLKYLDIPILFKYEFFGGNQGFYVEAGVHYSLGLSGTVAAEMKDIGNDKESESALYDWTGVEVYNYSDLLQTYPVSDYLMLSYDAFKANEELHLKKNEFGLILGGGSYFEMGMARLYVDLRYVHGLSNLNAQANQQSTKMSSKSIQLSASILYPLGL